MKTHLISHSINNSNIIDAPFCIVGGGMVGAACALALLKSRPSTESTQVILVEQRSPCALDMSTPPNLQVSALNMASHYWLSSIGAWAFIQQQRTHPYRALSVWEELSENSRMQGKNRVQFNAKMAGFEELGYMVENRVTQWGIWQALVKFEASGQLKILTADGKAGERVGALQSIQGRDDCAQLRFASISGSSENPIEGLVVNAQCVIAADGGHSTVRTLAGIETDNRPYKQHVLAVGVELDEPAGDETWQAFHASGPVALLPMMSVAGKHYAVLIWYDSAARVTEHLTMDDVTLTRAIKQHYPNALPNIQSVYARARFPITKMHASMYHAGRVVLVGDAAHTINPLAGQGVNLGFKDAKALVERLSPMRNFEARELSRVFAEYERARRQDNALMMNAMDAFYYGFSNDVPPVKVLRNAALSLANRSGYLKRKVLRHAMGL